MFLHICKLFLRVLIGLNTATAIPHLKQKKGVCSWDTGRGGWDTEQCSDLLWTQVLWMQSWHPHSAGLSLTEADPNEFTDAVNPSPSCGTHNLNSHTQP